MGLEAGAAELTELNRAAVVGVSRVVMTCRDMSGRKFWEVRQASLASDRLADGKRLWQLVREALRLRSWSGAVGQLTLEQGCRRQEYVHFSPGAPQPRSQLFCSTLIFFHRSKTRQKTSTFT